MNKLVYYLSRAVLWKKNRVLIVFNLLLKKKEMLI